jgi:plastocyanin
VSVDGPRPGRHLLALLAAATALALVAGCGGTAAQPSAKAPAPFDVADVSRDHPFTCKRTDGRCAVDYLLRLTDELGPRAALAVIGLLERKQALAPGIDEHQLAHAVGRETAQRFGMDARSFELCTNEFNYGCVHGFFEYALGRAASAGDAAVAICDSAKDPTLTTRFSCYHGVGHGVMMAKAYDLPAALRTCDGLGEPTAADGCWQGVFMENVNAAMKGEARPGVFSKTRPLAPCTAVAERHRHECYINHAGWLMQVTGDDVRAATRICAGAPGPAVSVCAQSIGLMVTNPVWQATLAPELAGRPMEQIAWRLCLQFPSGLRSDCVIAAVDNIAAFDDLDVAASGRFCTLVATPLESRCYRQIGVNLSRRTNDRGVVEQRCATLAARKADCLAGSKEIAPAPPPPVNVKPEPATTIGSEPSKPMKGAVVVKLTDTGFKPATVTIRKGQTVTFVNAGRDDQWPASNPHPIHTGYAGFDPGRSIVPGASWSFTFTRAGRWGFHNHLSPDQVGTIVVR